MGTSNTEQILKHSLSSRLERSHHTEGILRGFQHFAILHRPAHEELEVPINDHHLNKDSDLVVLLPRALRIGNGDTILQVREGESDLSELLMLAYNAKLAFGKWFA